MRHIIFHPKYPLWLLGAYAAYWTAWAFHPWVPKDWVLEHVLTVLWLSLLAGTYRVFRLSNISYTLIFIHLALHTIGAHYTYALVPYDAWFSSLFGVTLNGLLGLTRNHFDRLVHFCFGLLLAYPVREFFVRVANVKGFWGYYLPLDLTMSFSMLYELLEWGAAQLFGGELGQAYLGTQGDLWDAHKDMAMATMGAVVSMGVTALVNWKLAPRFSEELRQSLLIKDKEPLGEVKLRQMIAEKEKPGKPGDE